MIFQQIFGHTKLKQQLASTIDAGKISHAQLFFGVEGGVALGMALAYVQYMYCSNKTNGDSCGECASCLKLEKLAHPDVHFTFPHILSNAENTKKTLADDVLPEWKQAVLEHNAVMSYDSWRKYLDAENKQPGIGVADSDSILSKLSLKSYEGGYKTLVMWLPEYMNDDAANKLLKLIEEPPAQTLFILVSSYPEQIISTILSRTQRVHIPDYSAQEMTQFLAEKTEITHEAAAAIANISEGNVEYAINLALGNEENRYFEIYKNWMRLCYRKDISGLIDWVDEIATIGREQQKGFVKYALHIVRNALMYNYMGDKLLQLTDEEQEFNEKFAPYIHHNNIEGITKELNEAHYNLSRYAHPKPLFLDLSIKFNYLIHASKAE
jgi:DNA polymerase III subunit delta'